MYGYEYVGLIPKTTPVRLHRIDIPHVEYQAIPLIKYTVRG